MEDNLGDFLRKKLENFDETVDNWDKPDSSVKESVLQQIVLSSLPTSNYKKYGIVVLLLLLSFSTVGYIWYLQQQNKALKTAWLEEEKQLVEAKEKIVQLNKEQEIGKTNFEIIKENLETKNTYLIEQNNNATTTIQKQQNQITELRNQNTLLQRELKQQTRLIFAQKKSITHKKHNEREKISRPIIKINPQLLMPLTQKALEKEVSELPNIATIRPTSLTKRKRNRLEVGYEYGRLGFGFGEEHDFKELTETSKEKENKEIFFPSHRMYIAYSPRKNWWLKMGIQQTNMTIEQDLTFGAVYDKKGEYTKPNGTIGNQLTLRSTSAYTENQSNINVEIPGGVDLETGDLIVSKLRSYQEIALIQVPIGAVYRLGKNRLQWHLEGGTQWNKMKFKEYFVDGTIEAKKEELIIDKIEYGNKNIGEKQFWGLYGGVGLNYVLTKNWMLQANMNYRYTFYKAKDFEHSYFINRDFKIGFGYQF